jgi:hypothetical protein
LTPRTRTLFRLGVAHRIRHESARRKPGDFQAAVDAWGPALALDPSQYIWRRRIEQYGPRLAKPYAFYDWIEQARAEIARRGEAPIPLTVEPYCSELAGPVREALAEAAAPVEPDPTGLIGRDKHGSGINREFESERLVALEPRSRAPAWERYSSRSAARSTFNREHNSVSVLKHVLLTAICKRDGKF